MHNSQTQFFLGSCLFTVLILAMPIGCSAQFWFGPKFGIFQNQYNYFDDSRTEQFKSTLTPPGFLLGGIMNYSAQLNFSVQTELQFEYFTHGVSNGDTSDFGVTNKTRFGFLSIPILMKYQFRVSPTIRPYINVGPKVSVWAFGNGRIESDELEPIFDRNYEEYRFRFSNKFLDSEPSDDPNAKTDRYVETPKRLKYGLEFGGGTYVDLASKSRLMIDFRVTLGHSFMAFNRGADFTWSELNYFEDLEYKTNSFAVSVAYLFGYDPHDALEGASTISKSQKKAPKNQASEKAKSKPKSGAKRKKKKTRKKKIKVTL